MKRLLLILLFALAVIPVGHTQDAKPEGLNVSMPAKDPLEIQGEDGFHYRALVGSFGTDEEKIRGLVQQFLNASPDVKAIRDHEAMLTDDMAKLRGRLYKESGFTSDTHDLTISDADHFPRFVLKK